jgi:hypothetical protein
MRPAARWTYLALAIFVVIVCAQYMRSSLLQNYAYRFFVPFLPVVVIGCAVLMDGGWRRVALSADIMPVRFRVVGAFLAILVVLQLANYVQQYRRESSKAAAYATLITHEHIPAGLFLREHLSPSEWLVVLEDAGAIPYLSGLKTVDFGRLNDPVLARASLPDPALVDYFYSFDASALVLTSFDWKKLEYTRETALIRDDPRFDEYMLVRKYRAPSHDRYFQFVYLRRDLVESLDLDIE